MFNAIVSKEASDHDGRRAKFFLFLSYLDASKHGKKAQKNFLGGLLSGERGGG
jgi:hypothetical protein